MAGELVTLNYQYEYNGLLIGDGTPYDIIQIDGMVEFDVRSGSVEAFGRHGDIPGRHFAQARTITFEGHYLAQSDTHHAELRRDLQRAFRPIVEPSQVLPLIYRHPGGQLMRINCRPTRVRVDVDRDFALGYPKWAVRLELADPFAYSNEEQSVVVTMPVASSGLQFPLDFPLVMGQGSEGGKTIRNEGNAPAPWMGYAMGPAVNPSLVIERDGRRQQELTVADLSIGANDFLLFDASREQVLLNGVADRTGFLTGVSEWWHFEPGDTVVRFFSNVATELTGFNIRWRHTYWSD